ncbi:MAG: anti-sigma factor family protein [Acidobacteriota bacterium]
MSCRKLELHLTAYVDDQLPVGERTALFSHLGACKGCSHGVSLHTRLLEELLRLYPPVDPNDATWQMVCAKLQRAANRRRKHPVGH